jgi:hypothetical protein
MKFLSPLNLGHDISTILGNNVQGSSKRLNTLILGTSLINLGAITGTSSRPEQKPRSFWSLASFLAGGVLEFPETTAIAGVSNSNGGISRNSEYGYSGGTSSQIFADIDTNLLPALQANKVTYDLCWLSVLENDQTAGLSADRSLKNLLSIMAWVRSRYPDIKFIINTGAPSSFINTPEEIAAKLLLDKRVFALDNKSTIRVINTGRDYVSRDGVSPVVVTVRGSISGTTMVITEIVNNPTGIKLGVGMQVGTPNNVITSVPGFEGGIGVYGVTTGLTKSGEFNIFAYTDGDAATDLGGVHPNELACGLIARQAVPILESFGASNSSDFARVTPTPGFDGSTAFTGTGIVAGSTRPDDITFTGTGVAGQLLVEALEPGCRLTYSAIADSATPSQLAWCTTANAFTLPRGVDGFVQTLKVKIVSGAQYIHNLQVTNRQTDNGVLLTQNTWWVNGSGPSSGSTGVTWKDGDVITFKSPIMRSLGVGTLIGILTNYFSPFAKARTPLDAVIVIELIDQTFELVDDGSEIATLVAGTVTINDSRVRSGSKISFWRVINGGTTGNLRETARVVGTSVTIGSFTAAGSANNADTSQIRYKIEN